MRILIDCDGVVADLVGALIAAANPILASSAHNLPQLAERMFTAYEFKDNGFPAATIRVLNTIMNSPGFVRGLPPYRGAVEGVKLLHDAGHEAVFVTKPHAASQTWVWERTHWLEEHFPGCKVVHTAHKELIAGGVLIEDNPENLLRWQADRYYGQGVLINRPWNQGIKVGMRCVDMMHASSTLLGSY